MKFIGKMDKIQENIWKLEKIALEQDFFSLDYAAKCLGLTTRRSFDLIKGIKDFRILKDYSLPKRRGRPIKLYRMSLKELKIDKSREIFEYVERIKDNADCVILFGSLTTRFADNYSDIDLFVLSKRPVEKAEDIEVLNVNSFNDIPLTTKFNIISRGVKIIQKRKIPEFKLDFEDAIKLKEMKIHSDMAILKIAAFPESAAFLGMILLNIGYLLLLKQGIIPTCWKEVNVYLETFFEEINLLYPYYLKFEKERKIDNKQLSLNKEIYKVLENKVLGLWKKIKQKKYSIPPYIRPAM